MSDAWALQEVAVKAAQRLGGDDQPMPTEVLKLTADLASIIATIDGVDYIFTMQTLPVQRKRPDA